MECLEVFKQTQYPFIVSTKGRLAGESEYVKLLSECNCVVQISLCDPSYDKWEKGAPTFSERVEIAKRLIDAGVKRVNIRCQPYLPQIQASLLNSIKLYGEIGIHGIIVEGFKSQKKLKGMVQEGKDYVYPVSILKPRFEQIKKVCHENGVAFYSGENRLRKMGDSLCCCGIEGMEGFKANTYNLNHYFNDPNGMGEATPAMKAIGKTRVFCSMKQKTRYGRYLRTATFEKEMMTWKNCGKEHLCYV